MVRRHDGEVLIEQTWEHWHSLPKYKVVRKHHACRLHVTAFGAEQEPVATTPRASRRVDEASETVPADSPTEGEREHVPSSSGHESTQDSMPSGTSSERLRCEITDLSHGPHFLTLDNHEKQLIAKLHKNLGHPNAEKLSGLLQQQGYDPHVVKTALDYRRSSCWEVQNPKIARPSTIREALDFNDRIAVDAFSFTSAQDQRFQIYHIIDYATSFQLAFATPRGTSEEVIDGLMRTWFAWAGAPGSPHVDSGSELVSDEIQAFLQASNVRCTTSGPLAEWKGRTTWSHPARHAHAV